MALRKKPTASQRRTGMRKVQCKIAVESAIRRTVWRYGKRRLSSDVSRRLAKRACSIVQAGRGSRFPSDG